MSQPLEHAPPSTSPPSALGRTLRDLTSGSSGALLLIVLVFACYAWSSQSGYVWDDNDYVINNTALRSFNGLSRIWTEFGATPQYYPLTFTSFWLEVQAFGLRPGVSHVINALMHTGSVLILWQVLLRLRVPGAWAAAAVFGVHPIMVESVAWISERKNTLSLLLALSATWVYLRYGRLGVETRTAPAGEGLGVALPDEPTRLYRLFLALFVLALLSKTVVAVLPAMLLVIVWWQRGRLTRGDLVPLLPAFVLGAVAGAITSYLEHSPDYVGATGVEWDVPRVHRVMLVGQTAAFYAYKIIWPFALSGPGVWGRTSIPYFPTGFNYERWTVDAASLVQWLPLALLAATLVALAALSRKLGRGPLAAALLFLLGLAPACGLFVFLPMRLSWVADHFAYVGSIGLIVGVVGGLATLVGRKPAVAAVATGLMVVSLVGVTFWHAKSFRDPRTLWERTISQNQRSWFAAINMAGTLMDRANNDYARLMNNGEDAAAPKRRDDLRTAAEVWLGEALAINPNAYEAHRMRGALAGQRRQFDEALTHYRKAETVAGDMRVIAYQRTLSLPIADVLIVQGKTDEAIAELEKIEQHETTAGRRAGTLFASVRTKHGDLLMGRLKGKGRADLNEDEFKTYQQAMDQYTQAVDIGPEYIPAKLKLGRILSQNGESEAAALLMQDAIKIDPDNADTMLLTAQLLNDQHLNDAAAAQLSRLLSLYPAMLPAQLELAKTMLAIGRPDEARNSLRQTLEMFPNQPDALAMLASIDGRPTTQATRPATTSQPTTAP